MGTTLFNLSEQKFIEQDRLNQVKMSNIDKISRFGLGYFRAKYLSTDPIKPIKNFGWYKLVDEMLLTHEYILIVIPPGWGKTHGITHCYPIWRLCQDRKSRGVIISKSSNRARNFMGVIRRRLVTNEKLKSDFGGEFYDKRLTWNEEVAKIVGYDPDEATPSLTSVGITGQIESLRPHWIIMDDPLDKETAYSPAGVERFIDTLNITIQERIEETDIKGKLIMITHRYGLKDGIDRLIDSPLFKGSTLVIPAQQGFGPEGAAWVPSIKKGHSTCPGRRTDKALYLDAKSYKRRLPTYIYNALFLQNPTGRADASFNWDWVAPPGFIDGKPIHQENKSKWINTFPEYGDLAIDPAFTTGKTSDYTGMVGIGPHPEDEKGLIIFAMYKLELDTDFVKEYRKRFEVLGRHVKMRKMFVEINTARTLGQECKAGGLPVTEVNSVKGKEFRIGNLKVCFQSKPGEELAKADRRFYFHNMLRSESNKEIFEGYNAFMDEYQVYSPDSDTHEHIIDALGTYYYENYKKRHQIKVKKVYLA